MLLNFDMGEGCPCPEDIQKELYDFHTELRLHCGTDTFIMYLDFYKQLVNVLI